MCQLLSFFISLPSYGANHRATPSSLFAPIDTARYLRKETRQDKSWRTDRDDRQHWSLGINGNSGTERRRGGVSYNLFCLFLPVSVLWPPSSMISQWVLSSSKSVFFLFFNAKYSCQFVYHGSCNFVLLFSEKVSGLNTCSSEASADTETPSHLCTISLPVCLWQIIY